MKRIVILTCLKASRVCTGAACFQAFNQRTRAFARYGKEPLEIEAFMRCSGCGHTLENDRGLQEKVERIVKLHPEAVHLGICCCHDGGEIRSCAGRSKHLQVSSGRMASRSCGARIRNFE